MTPGFAPLVDIYEDQHRLTLKIEVPGIEKDIDVRIENNTIALHGERNIEGKERTRKRKTLSRPVAKRRFYPLVQPAERSGTRGE